MASTTLLIYSILILSYASTLHAQNCPPGEIPSNGGCEPCPIGTYRKNRNKCEACLPGTWQAYRGAVAEDLCQNCTPGTYSNKSASPTCKPCPPGTTSNFGATECSRCGPGTVAVMYGNGCQPCAEGSYSSGEANMKCEYCPFPLSAKAGSTSKDDCKVCPPGQHSTPCTLCSENFYKGPGMDRCVHCPPGTFTRGGGATGEAACEPCPKGTFFARRLERCRACRGTRIANGPGASFCRLPGMKCPNDYFENKNGDCERCDAGWKYVPGEKRCKRCPPDTVSIGGKTTKCKKCPKSMVVGSRQKLCQCLPGTFLASSRRCAPCPAGSEVEDFQHRFRECFPCERGTFKARAGEQLCQRCPFGMVSLVEGATECTTCGKGLMADAEGRECVSVRTNCPRGYKRRTVGADRSFSGCRRVSCGADTPKEEIGVSCTPCAPGERLKDGRCRRCPRDAVSDGGFVDSCTRCPEGLFRDERDGSKCSCLGSFAMRSGIVDGVCRKCPEGTFGSGTGVCQVCPAGTFASGVGNVRCTNCGGGTVAAKGAGRCERCPRGLVPERFRRAAKCVASAHWGGR